MIDLTPEAQHALLLLARKFGRTGISKITRSQLQDSLGIANYHRDLKPHIEDLEDHGLISVAHNGSYVVTEEGKATAWELENELQGENFGLAGARARASYTCLGESLTSLLSSSAPPPDFPTSSVASESSRSVKSSPRSDDRLLYRGQISEEPQEDDFEGVANWIPGGRIDRKSRTQNPLASALALATWFSEQVEETLENLGQGRIRAVRVKPLAKHLNDWKRDHGVPLATSQQMMSIFLASPERWARDKTSPPWQGFLYMKDELLARTHELESNNDETWSEWASLLLQEEDR